MRRSDSFENVAAPSGGPGSAMASTPWLVVGRVPVHILEEAGLPSSHPTRRVRDVHRALECLDTGSYGGCLVDARTLLDRPTAALELLRDRLGDAKLVVIASEPSAALRRAARLAGGTLLLPDSGERPQPRTGTPLPRADRAVRARTGLSPDRFASGCLEHLADADALVRYTVSALQQDAQATRVSVMVVDADRRALSLTHAVGLDVHFVGAVRCPVGRGVAGRVAGLGRPVAGYGASGGARGYAGSAYVVLPLGEGPDCIGVLNLTGFPDDTLPPDDVLAGWAQVGLRAGQALMAARRLQRAEALMATDPLTGLANRRAFEQALAREMDRAARSGDGLALALFDADLFKHVNDQFGHQAGDLVLAGIAGALTASFRDSDLVARWGGEEFAVLLPGQRGAHPEASLRALERARLNVAQRPMPLGPGLGVHRVTVSGGVAFHPVDGHDAHALVKAADHALLAAKDAGRNTIRRA